MGNLFGKKKKPNLNSHRPGGDGSEDGASVLLPTSLKQWEDKQNELNIDVLEQMRDDFHNRPDNFVLNALVLSLQFYKNFDRERAEITNHIRDRERALSKKLNASKRTIIYQGGFEEIAGTHALYQPPGSEYLELPSPLQVYVVHDNVEVHPDEKFEDLQTIQYDDPDGPAYRFCAELSKRHIGYVRLRTTDIIPGVNRNNTYEEIYSVLPITAENKPDPIVDPRPLRRVASFKEQDYADDEEDEEDDDFQDISGNSRLTRSKITEIQEDEEDEISDLDDAPRIVAKPRAERRPSGVMPQHIEQLRATYMKTRDEANKNLKEKQSLKGKHDKTKSIQNKFKPPQNTQNNTGPNMGRRGSGTMVFPKMGPSMNKMKVVLRTEMSDLFKKLGEIEEESEEESEEEKNEEDFPNAIEKVPERRPSISQTPIFPTNRRASISVVLEGQNEIIDVVEESSDDEPRGPDISARINEGCFLNRKIKFKGSNAYGLDTHAEKRTYLSSERYLECFEEDFPQLAELLGKENLRDTCKTQPPAVFAEELIIEGIGPRFRTEFIPTLILKEWPQFAFEWRIRERNAKIDHSNKMIFRWPTKEKVEEVCEMGCNLVPIGHYDPRNPNKVMKIEWQIQFARAEQILLRSLGHSQIRLMLIIEALFRDHLGDDVHGLRVQHLRYIMFWMCEHNFRDWTEEKLGTKLKAYLKTFYNCLANEHLPHYFMFKVNLLENIPDKYLRTIQALVKKMRDNLPLYLMHTFKRFRFEEDFYPDLDVLELYKMVTPKTWSIAQLNPKLLGLIEQPVDDGMDVLYSDSEEEEEHNEIKKKLHEERRRREKAAKSKSDSPIKKIKKDDIDINQKVNTINDLRAAKLLSLFSQHYIGMARASNMFRSYPQAYKYLLLAGNMATLLEENRHSTEAKEFREDIDYLLEAARGGVRDMLTTSWGISETHDTLYRNPSIRGSNWELKKEEPLPQPPKEKTVKNTTARRGSFDTQKSGMANSINSLPNKTKLHVTESAQTIQIASSDSEDDSTDL